MVLFVRRCPTPLLQQQAPCPNGRRTTARGELILCALALAAIALLACGCGQDAEAPDEPGRQRGDARISEEGFVETLAALSAALDEGHRGDEAWERALELGAFAYSRAEIEAFADAVRPDADRWRGIMEAVEARTAEIQAEPDSTR
jgi:hypothetical protein